MRHLTSLTLALAASLRLATAARSHTVDSTDYPVYGWCDFEWVNAHKIANVQCGAKDNACDSHAVFAELYTYRDNNLHTVEKEFARYDNHDGCHTSHWDDTKHSWDSLPAGNQFKARVKACVNIQGGPDECYWGNVVDNPHA